MIWRSWILSKSCRVVNRNRFPILLGMLCLVSTTLVAQVGEPRNIFSLGVNAGMNLNRATFVPGLKQDLLRGWTGGITARYMSEKYFSMLCGAQLEVNVSQRGWKERFETTDADGLSVKDPSRSYRRDLTYIDVPFLAHLAFGKEPGLQFFLHAGPQVGFLIGKDKETFVNVDMTTLTDTQKALYNVPIGKRFDYGLTGGVGVEWQTKRSGRLLLEGRYYFALSDFYSTAKKDYFARAAHSTISVKLAYLFDFTR